MNRIFRSAFVLLLFEIGAADNGLHFVNVTKENGIAFTHKNGMKGHNWIAETVGSGVGLFDLNGDGWLDIWLVQSGIFDRSVDMVTPTISDRIFLSTLVDGKRKYVDVTLESGVSAPEYGMGIAAGDIDNDGDIDIFLANYGQNQLYENKGNGQFKEVLLPAISEPREWSVSASFVDVDQDGLLDLYVANYLEFSLTNHKDCRDIAGRSTYCTPETYRYVPDRLYRNEYTKTNGVNFEEVTDSGIRLKSGPALGVVSEDFNQDGRVDIYLANDGAPNFLWLNETDEKKRIHFRDAGTELFVALNGNGAPEAGMGIAAEDFDHDCDVDIFVTHLTTETNTLYRNEGKWFYDATNESGLAASSAPFTGFGVGWIDFDNDGDLDIFSGNGAVFPIPELRAEDHPYPLIQRNQLWVNVGNGKYQEVKIPDMQDEKVSRGVGFGDLDNDGDVDIVVNNNQGEAQIWRNDSKENNWIGIELIDPNGPEFGSKVHLLPDVCRAQRIASDGSFASASDQRVIFGLGRDDGWPEILVHWADGKQEVFGPLAINQYHQLSRRKDR